MSDRRVYAIYVNHPADHLTTGDYHHMYIVAESPQAARNWAHDKATNDGCRANVFQDEFAATCVIFDEQVPADEPIGIRSVEVWNGPTCQRRDCKSPRSCTHPIESKQVETPEFVTAEDAPIDVPLWNVEGQNPDHVTLMRIDTMRTATRSLVRWIFKNGTERTYDFGEQVAVKLPTPTPADTGKPVRWVGPEAARTVTVTEFRERYMKCASCASDCTHAVLVNGEMFSTSCTAHLESLKASAATPALVKAARKCKFCELDIEHEGDRWVITMVGGTYDRCTVNTGDPTEYPTAGHRPA